MTSENEVYKTNEFLRRRKLRLQQVREQSKDIAKNILQRVRVEKFRQVVDLDARKQKEYLQQQEKLVKQLELLYAKGIKNVGASHRSASEAKQSDNPIQKPDLSKLRGKEAAAELKRQKQERLDEQKKKLDRKLQAREAANEISREKSAAIANKLQLKPSLETEEARSKGASASDTLTAKDNENVLHEDKAEVTRNDMGTQWEEEMPKEWEHNIPQLSLLINDDIKDNIVESKSNKSKRLDLFALSDEMPSSLRGAYRFSTEDRIPEKTSLTLVSEYLQNRGLRLRESETTSTTKKKSDDLHSLKQTILRTRTSIPPSGTLISCQVHDDQLIPVPSWQAETYCDFCTHNICEHKQCNSRHFKNISNSQIDKTFRSIRPANQDLLPSSVLRGTSPYRRNKACQRTFPGKSSNVDKSAKSIAQSNALTKKNSVTMYNHSTRDTRDVPYRDKGLVVRDLQTDDDAYSQAMKEVSMDNNKDKHYKRIQDMRNKIAMTKQNVEKEYKDTMTFLNSLPKDKGNKPIKNAYMDGRRQQMQKEIRQQKLQQEYKKIEKERREHTCRNKIRSVSKSPAKADDDDLNSKDFQYSWMPVPESDGSLAIHTIPTTLKEGKSGNTVKFSKIDSYHEYRSRHKHTPPTKDTCGLEKSNKRLEAVIVQNDSSDSNDTLVSDSSSKQSLSLENNDKNTEQRLSDAERIIIYKILDSKRDKKAKKAKLVKDIAKSLSSIDKVQKYSNDDNNNEQVKKTEKRTNDAGNRLSFEQLNEGVYKSVNENGDNITSMYFSDRPQNGDKASGIAKEIGSSFPCCHNNKSGNDQQHNKVAHPQWDSNDDTGARTSKRDVECNSACASCKHSERSNILTKPTSIAASAASTSSFKTATNDKANNAMPLSNYIKLVDASGQDAGNFYIGASGFLKDDAYEVVFQLRKKDAGKSDDVKIDDKKYEKDKRVQSVEELSKKRDEKLPETATVTEVSASQKTTDENQDGLADRNTPVTDSKEMPSQKSRPKKDSTVVNVVTRAPINENVKEDVIGSGSSDEVMESSHTIEASNLKEKGVYTPYQDSYAIPSHITKSDPVLRPATSTYTQTTLNSPNHRPVYFHMSSSTSTAYMSPPEMILPHFLRHGYHLTDDEINDPRNFNMQENIEITEQQEYCEEYAGCKCKRCSHGRKVTLSKATPKHCCRKSKCRYNKNSKAPPNTARSCDTEGMTNIDDVCKDIIESPNVPEKKLKCNCRKCELHARSNASLKSHIQNINRNVASKKSSRNSVKRVTSSATSSHKGIQFTTEKRHKPQLTPVIKSYINKLLSLNKESLKAVEVIDQECSSIATPGSSVINVPHNNIDGNKIAVDQKISLEQIKTMLMQQIMNNLNKKEQAEKSDVCMKNNVNKNINPQRIPRKKSMHKIKSLNISKRLFNSKTARDSKQTLNKPASSSSSPKDESPKSPISIPTRNKIRSKSSPTPRQIRLKIMRKDTASDIVATQKSSKAMILTDCHTNSSDNKKISSPVFYKQKPIPRDSIDSYTIPSHRATITSTSPDSENTVASLRQQKNDEIPINTSTQTNENIDGELNFMKLAENKLQNMEKIADLTEKCTKRLSNLAKVLEEVRKHKSLAYSQISTSDSTSDSDQKSDRNVRINKKPVELDGPSSDNQKSFDSKSPVPVTTLAESSEKTPDSTDFIPFLIDIPKPGVLKSADCDPQSNLNSTEISNRDSSIKEDLDPLNTKSRGKPPPALSRMNLKLGHEHVIPHELSTVIEVDSPMSIKYKNHSARNDTKHDVPDSSDKIANGNNDGQKNEQTHGVNSRSNNSYFNPDLLQTDANISKRLPKISTTESSEDSKVQMMDLKQFNEIMLKPFFSIQEYAKQYSIGTMDEGSNFEEFPKDAINEELSSLHSDGSLPDVIGELLKRNIINQPFTFDSASNANSTPISSDSTLSALALSKARKKSSVTFKNEENVAETSDTFSFSSNPDLENAFKKLGMGWASSTLKKTKERLALSSSSNTSSSSFSQFKIKNFNNQDIPVLVTDSISSVLNLSKKGRNTTDTSKNAGQQTSLTNSMTVKEFLTNELAKKITFTNKSRNDTEEEFVSLFETKMPENMKHSTQIIREERSIDDSVRSASNNRARTSTPVQLFKSTTYHSSSSSNISNVLFSNADDLSSVKVTSNSMKHSTSDKDDLTIPNFSLKTKKGSSDCSKSD